MSKFPTPEDLLNSQVVEFNKGNIDFLMTLYEKDACFASQPGQVVKDQERIRRTFQDIIDLGGKLEARAKESTFCERSCSSNYGMVDQWNRT